LKERTRQIHLFDSNIVIYHLNQALPTRATASVEDWIVEGAHVSVVARIEVLGYPEQTPMQEQLALETLRYFEETPLCEPVVQGTITLWQAQSIRLGDAIIAATALEHDLSLVTRNTDDFEWIDGLSLVNPFEN
jgi:Predicted nucleic acid-binding protein, contains PIN domain